MTVQDPLNGEHNITERLFNFIDGLSTDMQFNLYKQLIEDKVSTQLFKLIIDLSDEEKVQFSEKLGDMPFEAEPIQTINLDENESFMRENPRKNCLVAVKCKVGDTLFSSYITSISVDGVFIEVNDRFPVGQKIRMAFKLPNVTNPLELKGQINRNGFQGFGVNFLDLNQDQQEIIRDYISNTDLVE